MITLYHFCAAHMVEDIRKYGLTLGMTPIIRGNKAYIVNRTQWLTDDPDPKKQSWATNSEIPYSRTAYRLLIEIPDNRQGHLCRAADFMRGFSSEIERLITEWEGSEHWYVYDGCIPNRWIKEIAKMEEPETQGVEA